MGQAGPFFRLPEKRPFYGDIRKRAKRSEKSELSNLTCKDAEMSPRSVNRKDLQSLLRFSVPVIRISMNSNSSSTSNWTNLPLLALSNLSPTRKDQVLCRSVLRGCTLNAFAAHPKHVDEITGIPFSLKKLIMCSCLCRDI
jgi:hypothetical protein